MKDAETIWFGGFFCNLTMSLYLFSKLLAVIDSVFPLLPTIMRYMKIILCDLEHFGLVYEYKFYFAA